MLFKPELVQQILKGKKTQTRRLLRDDYPFPVYKGHGKRTVITNHGRIRYQVGKDYAVCPGRGKPAPWWTLDSFGDVAVFPTKVGDGGASISYAQEKGFKQARIRLNGLIRQRVEDISEDDARAEGFNNRAEFLEAFKRINPKSSPTDFVWVLTFELVK